MSYLIVKITSKRKILNRSFTTDTSNLKSEIDSLVYKLYNLTDDEIKIIESKE